MTMSSGKKGLCGFGLVFVGTVGLLANELVFDWGRTATLIFAGLNVVGLIALSPTLWKSREKQGK